MKRAMIVLLGAGAFLAAGESSHADILIEPADAKTVRETGSSYSVVNFLAVKNTGGLEDRTILEFPMAAMPADPTAVYLEFGSSNFDPNPPAGLMDVFSFLGDGQVHTQDFFAGTYYTTLLDPGLPPTLFTALDVTPLVQQALGEGAPYVSFRLSTLTADRWFLGEGVGALNPQLRVVPEAGSASILLVSSGLFFVGRRGRGRLWRAAGVGGVGFPR